MDCSSKEDEIKKGLPDGGKNFEGCGLFTGNNKQEVDQ